MPVSLHNPATLQKPVGLYSHVSVSHGNRVIAVAGQVAIDAEGALVGAGDIELQVEQALANVERALADVGAGMTDVVKFTTYLTDPDHLSGFHAARSRLFPALFGTAAYPPNTLVVVSRLVRPELLVEIDALAVAD